LTYLKIKARNFNVSLQGSDPAPGASHLEVHVAQVILQPQDVQQDGVLVVA
jgi:hypothetical protein